MIVYADTSTVGGCFDDEFKEWSLALFEEFKTGLKLLMISDMTLQELEFAPQHVRDKLAEVPDKHRISTVTSDEAIKLAGNYIHDGALTNKSFNDALHIVLATLGNATVLASWNFKHVVNLNRIRLYNSINLRTHFATQQSLSNDKFRLPQRTLSQHVTFPLGGKEGMGV